MLIGRTQELKNLDGIYRTAGSALVVLYGRKGIGKTALAKEFLSERQPFLYYTARQVTKREQLLCMQEEFKLPLYEEEGYVSFLKRLLQGNTGKTVLVLDEFQWMAEESSGFAEAVAELFEDKEAPPFLLLLISSSVNWVENAMVGCLGKTARYITSFFKLKEFSFLELVDFYHDFPVEESVYANAVLGGVPAYLKLWDGKQGVKENIVGLFLRPQAPLYEEAEHFLKRELRELSAYNAILAALADGRYKLNDIYARTGFSRAKISVYLKNLIALDVVEKLFSYGGTEQANAQKGLYRIKDACLRFWYRFVYKNVSAIEEGRGEEVYEENIVSALPDYMRESFGIVCMEFLRLMNQYGRLKHTYQSFGSWFGKEGLIDILAGDGQGHYLAGFCDFSEEALSVSALEEERQLLVQAGIGQPEEYYLFARSGFTKELEEEAAARGITLVRLEDL